MSTEIIVKVGDVVTGSVANRLPVGSQIRYHERNADDPVWTKHEDTDLDPEWATPGQTPWPIDEAAHWMVESLPGDFARLLAAETNQPEDEW